MRQVPFRLEELHAFVERHAAGVHPDADHVTGVPQQRILQLSQAHLEERGVLLLGDSRRAAVAFLQHHLLGVVCPAFQVGACPEQLPHLVWRPLHPEELHVMTRVRLVDRGALDDAAVEARHVLLHLLPRPGRLRQGDVEESLRRPLLERPRGLHGRDRGCAHEWGRLLHDRGQGRGNGDDAALLDEPPEIAEGVAKGLQELGGRRVVRAQIAQHVLSRSSGTELAGRALELALVAAQIDHAHLEQVVEGQIHRLFEEQLLAEILGADAEIAIGPRQEVLLEELLVSAQRGDDLGIRLGERAQDVRVLRLLKGRGDVRFEEGDDPGKLLERDRRIPARGVLEILPRGLQHGGHLLLAIDQRSQPFVGRGELAAHDYERAPGDSARVDVRIPLPAPDDRQIQEGGADIGQQQLAVGGGVRRAGGEVDVLEPFLEFLQGSDARVDRRAREVLELRVVLVQAGRRRARGRVLEEHLLEVAVRQRCQLDFLAAAHRLSAGACGEDEHGRETGERGPRHARRLPHATLKESRRRYSFG